MVNSVGEYRLSCCSRDELICLSANLVVVAAICHFDGTRLDAPFSGWKIWWQKRTDTQLLLSFCFVFCLPPPQPLWLLLLAWISSLKGPLNLPILAYLLFITLPHHQFHRLFHFTASALLRPQNCLFTSKSCITDRVFAFNTTKKSKIGKEGRRVKLQQKLPKKLANCKNLFLPPSRQPATEGTRTWTHKPMQKEKKWVN